MQNEVSNMIITTFFEKQCAQEGNDWKRVEINEDFCGWDDGIMGIIPPPNCFSLIIFLTTSRPHLSYLLVLKMERRPGKPDILTVCGKKPLS